MHGYTPAQIRKAKGRSAIAAVIRTEDGKES
jgi:hypothetical protein